MTAPATARRVAGTALAALLIGLAMPSAAGFAASGAQDPAPPTGRPPMGPLQRVDPKRYDVQLDVHLSTIRPLDPDIYISRGVRGGGPEFPYFVREIQGDRFDITGGGFVMPIAPISTFHRTELETLDAKIWVDSSEVPGVADRASVEPGLRHGVQRGFIPLPRITDARDIRLQFNQRSIAWASRIDDAAACRLPWPETIPEEARDALGSEPFIELDEDFWGPVILELFGPDLTATPPYVVAKRIAAHAAENFRVARQEVFRGVLESIDGLMLDGSGEAARRGYGSAGDLACINVVMLRTAGIPARPVIGVTEREDRDDTEDRTTFDVWVEFYLHGAGWVPYDPERLVEDRGYRSRPETMAWSDFGTWDELNERIPMAWAFSPRGTLPAQRSAVYGWAPVPNTMTPAQYIDIEITGRPTPRDIED